MIVVSDASPINVLVRIDYVELLPELFGAVLVPPAVIKELSHSGTPDKVRNWLASQPSWLQIKSPQSVDPTLELLDMGEREAISLALELKAELLLVDDKRARRAALDRGLHITGAVGVLEAASARRLLALSEAFQRLQTTDFLVSQAILDQALDRDAARKNIPH